MWAALPAFLLEAVFYLGSIFQETRAWLAQFRPARMQAVFLWFSALAPYLIFSLSAGTFERNSFYLLAGLTAVLSFWYALLPRRPTYDFGFLVVAAAPLVSRVFARIYRSPDEHMHADILGHLMWIRLGIAALLVMREWNPGAFGFWPRCARMAHRHSLLFGFDIPVILLALGLHDVRFELRAGPWWQVAGLASAHFSEFYGWWRSAKNYFFAGSLNAPCSTARGRERCWFRPCYMEARISGSTSFRTGAGRQWVLFSEWSSGSSMRKPAACVRRW